MLRITVMTDTVVNSLIICRHSIDVQIFIKSIICVSESTGKTTCSCVIIKQKLWSAAWLVLVPGYGPATTVPSAANLDALSKFCGLGLGLGQYNSLHAWKKIEG